MSARASESLALTHPPAIIRDRVRRALTAAPTFGELDEEDRREIAHSLVRIAHAAKLMEEEASETAPARSRLRARAMDAGEHLSGAAVDRMAGTTQRVLNAISFPRFVGELITGVFRAMVETNQQQLQQYIQLVRGVSQSLDGFSSLGSNDDMARRWLVEQFPQSYEIERPDPDDPPDPDDEPEPLRLISVGSPPSAESVRAALQLEPSAEIPSGGGESLVPFVRRSLARNRQQMLATMVQMGMQRIVIDSGRIHASMRFHIDARSAAAEDRTTGVDARHSIAASGGGAWGPFSASASVSSTIGFVSTTDVSTREDLSASADLNSSVELHFRTDQVPLDRIASQQTVERLRLNTLNPERELDIARQEADARLTNRREIETARAPRARPSPAPSASSPPSAPPPPPGTQGGTASAPGGGTAPTQGGGTTSTQGGAGRTSVAPGTSGSPPPTLRQ